MKAAIKICGLRRLADVEEINKYPEIKYAGFVFFKKSKRCLTAEQARELAAALREDIKAVGVFAENSVEEIKYIADTARLDILQLHSDEDAEFCKALSDYHLWRAIRMKDKEALSVADSLPVEGFVLDSYTPEYGGCGKVFDWKLASEFAKNHFTMVAGGINASNIRQAYSAIHPNGIDLSSAIETDGFKDEGKIKQLIDEIRKEV
jgi:phosphoribosylanthranilate isomerase